ncbi:MAG: phosphoribosyltransferase [Thermoplasmata archaeon]
MAPTVAVFEDRTQAGRRLADSLAHYAGHGVIVLALPRGGVPVAAEIAVRLDAPLDVFVVRKVGAPGNLEYGLGAVAEGAPPLLDLDRVHDLGLERRDLEAEILRQTQEVEDRVRLYREGRPLPTVEGRVVILVDDGLATGSTARAAVRALRGHRPRRVVLAVGVASVEAHEELSHEVDEVVCPCIPQSFVAVGGWYREFPPVPDAEVLRILRRHRSRSIAADAAG